MEKIDLDNLFSQNPDIHQDELGANIGSRNFEVLTATKRFYYAVRKQSKTLGRIKLPGLFQVEAGYDLTLAVAAFIVELVALLFLAYVISSVSKNISTYWLMMGILLFVALDFTAAWLHHMVLFPYISIRDNEYLRIFPSMRDIDLADIFYQDYKARVSLGVKAWRHVMSRFWMVFIICLGVLKLLLYIVHVDEFFSSLHLPGHLQISISGLVLIAYGFAAYVHCYHTGFFLAHLRLQLAIKKDLMNYHRAQTKEERDPYQCHSYSSETFTMKEFCSELLKTKHPEYMNIINIDGSERVKQQIEKGIECIVLDEGHKIIFTGETINGSSFQIIARGLLKDEDLIKLVNAQKTPLAMDAIAILGHHVQLKCMKGE
ncbi:hypothetical protein [Candidatus Magnetaquicoccus inordinatus]|uniref:hypothetical protein n=1 Tax=Candidatus Magnetaquicoccus inordinatus TaxID=2496818 RepID=UPI00102AB02E|nr:hypothetical protein [Candidatus Magnetaquicoccus inordinatus]